MHEQSKPLYPLVGPRELSRRSFVRGTASFAAAVLLSNRALSAVLSRPPLVDWPFRLGVASGDPSPDGFVIWTRLAPLPLEGGGMGPDPVEVQWEVAEDERMQRIVRRGRVVANAAWGHSVHVEVAGLRPDRWYWYRFHAAGQVSPVGRSRTFPEVGASVERLRFAFASCQNYQAGLYTAFDHMAREELDLVVHLGDYIYEKGPNDSPIRKHNGPEIFSLDDYRNRYALYKLDPALQAAHAAAPWIVTWDDHEVSNNYANDIHERPEGNAPAAFLARRALAYQAYFEHLPLRRNTQPKGPDMPLYRRLGYGRLAEFNVLDTRQFRTDQPLGDGMHPDAPEQMDPNGTMLGATQREWLFNGLSQSTSTWNVLAQQVMVARVGRAAEAGGPLLYSMDKWAGYEFERRRMLRYIGDCGVPNPIVITGDIHSNWANELVTDFDQPETRTVAAEFVGTSISSGGDGADQPPGTEETMSKNPWVKYFNNERGYVRCEVTPEGWRSDYRTVPYVTRPGAPIRTARSFLLEPGSSKLNPV